MSMELMVKAMKTKVGNPLRKLVLIKLADNASDQGECWPSYQHIADQCEIARSTVKTHIRELEKAGLVRREFRRNGELNQSNVFHLNLWGGAVAALGGGAAENPPGATENPGGGAAAAPRTSHLSEPVNEPKPTCTSVADGFDQFWKLYPKKKSRKDALKAWNKLNPGAGQQATMIAALANHCVSRDWAKDGGQYIPNAATWLNGERWLDVLQPAAGTARPGSFNDLPQHTPDMYQESHDGRSNF
ncbi:helix-turn-helix domain-containing protein [Pseudomonas oryziphila]|uniref:Helix-turn-helix domain-containing protein n=1 Tax=Pseudomonas entomophila TaxID=312306 RepID=A0A3Q8U1Z5_9PSED|nr:helix-turn-helix domain-containing protein [Pseudomonas oryziphila]AZL69224.1 helix-turn-helix domain-containing protein [Pseudomonas oryziphila]